MLPMLIVFAALAPDPAPITLRVATFNVEDVRTTDLKDANNPRLKRIAEVIQRLRPNILFLNEIAYDQPGAPGFAASDSPGRNAQRFADLYLAVPQAADLKPLRFHAFMAPVNTGIPSGFDLDNDGRTVTSFPVPADARMSAESRAYGNDCWGFGTFPGQYGMALLVDEHLTLNADKARTFQRLPWDYVSGAFIPSDPDTSEAWFSPEELKLMRLSSKSHWDVPVTLANGATLHLLCSHPTPPAFDGAEQRNQKRNHDEIRFWMDYIERAPYIVDDANTTGGLPREASFIILGDLNADPNEGTSFKNPIDTLLGTCQRINTTIVPLADLHIEGYDEDDTADFKLRVDYVLPSTDLTLERSGIWRTAPAGVRFPSDHFPVWIEVTVPPPNSPPNP